MSTGAQLGYMPVHLQTQQRVKTPESKALINYRRLLTSELVSVQTLALLGGTQVKVNNQLFTCHKSYLIDLDSGCFVLDCYTDAPAAEFEQLGWTSVDRVVTPRKQSKRKREEGSASAD